MHKSAAEGGDQLSPPGGRTSRGGVNNGRDASSDRTGRAVSDTRARVRFQTRSKTRRERALALARQRRARTRSRERQAVE